MWLLLAFIAIPLIEIALFIQVGGVIGLWPTLAIVVLTAVAGTSLLRVQGRAALGELRRSFAALEDPSRPLAHGAMIVLAGALLLTPGFFTDALGLVLLIPRVRDGVLRYLRSRVHVERFEMGRRAPPQGTGRAADDIIEGEFHEIDPSRKSTHAPSGWTRH